MFSYAEALLCYCVQHKREQEVRVMGSGGVYMCMCVQVNLVKNTLVVTHS